MDRIAVGGIAIRGGGEARSVAGDAQRRRFRRSQVKLLEVKETLRRLQRLPVAATGKDGIVIGELPMQN